MALSPELQEFTTASPTLANYDYTDIANGLGYVTFDCFATKNSTTTNLCMGSSPLNSNPPYTNPSQSQSGTNNSSYDFVTSTLKLPRLVSGSAYASFTQGAHGGAGGTSIQVGLTLLKYDGTNYTALSSKITGTITEAAGGVDVVSTQYLKIPLTETIIAMGECLVLRVEPSTINGGTVGYVIIMHDPLNRDNSDYVPVTAATKPTYFKVNIPFKLDL